MDERELTPEEKEEKIKAEKMKIALEKMKAASFQKLFVKVFDGDCLTSKTMLIDQLWTAREVRNKMIGKNNVEMGPNWCIMEKLPAMNMGKIVYSNFLLSIGCMQMLWNF